MLFRLHGSSAKRPSCSFPFGTTSYQLVRAIRSLRRLAKMRREIENKGGKEKYGKEHNRYNGRRGYYRKKKEYDPNVPPQTAETVTATALSRSGFSPRNHHELETLRSSSYYFSLLFIRHQQPTGKIQKNSAKEEHFFVEFKINKNRLFSFIQKHRRWRACSRTSCC